MVVTINKHNGIFGHLLFIFTTKYFMIWIQLNQTSLGRVSEQSENVSLRTNRECFAGFCTINLPGLLRPSALIFFEKNSFLKPIYPGNY